MRTIGKISQVQVYLRCDVLKVKAWSVSALLCVLQHTEHPDRAGHWSPAWAVVVSCDKHQSWFFYGKTSCMGRSADSLGLPLKHFGALPGFTGEHKRRMGTSPFLQKDFASFFFLIEIKLMLICDRLRIKQFLTFFAVFLCCVADWFKIYLIFLGCGNKHNWRKKLARNKLTPLSMQC